MKRRPECLKASSAALQRLGVALAIVLAVAVLPAFGGIALAQQAGGANPSGWSPPRTVYIPQTGQSIDGVFLDFWRANNGIANYGYPITPEVEQGGRIVQYYDYARFEYVPDDPNGAVVRLGNIGEELRPKLIYRSVAPGRTGGVASEAAGYAQAWMPLAEATAAKEPSANWRYVPETGHSVRYGFKQLWEATGEAAYLGNPLTEEYVLDGITYQVFERGQLAWKQGSDPWFVSLGPVLARLYDIPTDPTPQGNLPVYSEELFVPPPPAFDASGAPPPPAGAAQSIVVSISQQRMWAYEGESVVMSSLVSTGRPGFDTPTGTFWILVKKEIEDMEGLIGGEYYNVEDVPDVMYFTNEGHAFHGTYWHNNFGAVMSHGCVNLPLDVAAWLYDWTPIGTIVLIVP